MVFQNLRKRKRIYGNDTVAVYITCDGHEMLCDSGRVNLKTRFRVIDVINARIINKVGIEFEKTSKPGAGGTLFKIRILECTEDIRRNIRKTAVIPDAMVYIYGSDIIGNHDAKAIKSALCNPPRRRCIIRERGRIIHLCPLTISRIIWNFGISAILFLIIPITEKAGVLKLLRYILKKYPHAALLTSYVVLISCS